LTNGDPAKAVVGAALAFRDLCRATANVPGPEGVADLLPDTDIVTTLEDAKKVALESGSAIPVLRATIAGMRVLTFLLLLLVATVATLGALWSPNPTWGTAMDYLIGFLIGFGINITATTPTATTVDALRKNWSTPAT
jgi:hypothetical protein